MLPKHIDTETKYVMSCSLKQKYVAPNKLTLPKQERRLEADGDQIFEEYYKETSDPQ